MTHPGLWRKQSKPRKQRAAIRVKAGREQPKPMQCSGPPTAAEIARIFTVQHVSWVDSEQTTLQGTVATEVEALHHLLDRMGVGQVTLLLPERRYVFARSEYGARTLNCTSEPLDGDETGDETGDGGYHPVVEDLAGRTGGGEYRGALPRASRHTVECSPLHSGRQDSVQ